MKPGVVNIVFRKEMIDLLRDRRSILAMIVFPILINPILLFGSARLREMGECRLEETVVRVAVAGAAGRLRSRIEPMPHVEIHPADDPEEAVRSGDVDIAVRLPGDAELAGTVAPEATLFYDASREISGHGRERLRKTIEEWRRATRGDRLETIGAPHLASLLPVRETNLASDKRMTGGMLGKIAPIMLVFLLINGASFAAVDLFAGERERKTIETLLTSLADRGSVVAGKFITVVVSAAVAAALFLGSSFFFTKLGWIGDDSLRQSFAVDPPAAAIVLFLSLPLAFFLSAVLVLISSHARSYREAQTLLLPVVLLGVVPAVVSILPGIEIESIVAIAPIAGVAVAVREALAGSFAWPWFLLVAGSHLLYAVIVLRWATAFLASEKVILGDAAAPPALLAGEERPRAREATAFFIAQILVLYYLGSWVQAKSLLPGLLITLWGFLLVPTFLFALRYRLSFRRHLSFRRPDPLHLLAGALLAPGSLLGANLLFQLQSRFLPVPENLMEGFDTLFGGGEIGIIPILLVVAVSPGICEEIFFRGLILGQHRRVLSPARAVLIGGVLFGLFHLSIYRFIPTAFLGCVAGALVVRSRSILPAMVLHILYNGLTLLAAQGEEGSRWERLHGFDPLWIGLVVLTGVAGVASLRLRKPAATVDS